MKPSRTLRIYRGTLTVASIRPITGVMRYLDANGLVCCRRYRDRPSPQYACMFLIFFSSLLKRQGFRISVRFMYRNITGSTPSLYDIPKNLSDTFKNDLLKTTCKGNQRQSIRECGRDLSGLRYGPRGPMLQGPDDPSRRRGSVLDDTGVGIRLSLVLRHT